MVKNKIVLYTQERAPLSLGNLSLNSGYFIEDIFDAVEDAENFEELTEILGKIIAHPLIIDRTTTAYIRYLVDGNYLKIKIKNACCKDI